MSDPAILFQLGFYILLGMATIHALVLAYHWRSYGANKTQSLVGIAVYLLGISLFLLIISISLVQL